MHAIRERERDNEGKRMKEREKEGRKERNRKGTITTASKARLYFSNGLLKRYSAQQLEHATPTQVPACIHEEKSGIPRPVWTLFNDFSVHHVAAAEAVTYDIDWKVPCILYYTRRMFEQASQSLEVGRGAFTMLRAFVFVS